ncbi:MAG: hypothetical protein Q8O76_06880, partial [Chloroflexota bacterium]|nr:hypothetical protein [Chloroflexota bacterium]
MGKLMETARIGGMELRNRIVFLPMATHLAGRDGAVTQPLIDYYARRAQGGAGLIVVEAAAIDPHYFMAPTQVRVCDDKNIPGLAALARA